MEKPNTVPQSPSSLSVQDRRTFLRGAGAALAGSALAGLAPAALRAAPAGELRVGLVGCGGRGTGAAVNALTADPAARLVAVGDVFADHADGCLTNIRNSAVGERVLVDDAHRFVGFDAYQKVIDSCDVVLLASTPHFRPQQLQAAVDAGKHIFAEKPVATDAPGLRKVMATCRQAEEKGLCVVSGLCYRYEPAKRAVIKQVHDGAVGRIVALQCTYNTGGLWHKGRRPDWSEMEYQMRNWLYFTWLSGDHIVEQSIHSIDKILWVMKDEPPAKCCASGGRQVRTDEKFGNIYDHFNCVFEWASGVKLFHSCRQWEGADSDVSDYVFGTDGTAAIQGHWITGANPWRFQGENENMYESEMRALFGAIRAGTPINNGDYMCKSNLMAMMGRMSAYTGKVITWEQALNSAEDLSPPAYEWGPVPVAPVAVPGATPFV